MCLRLTARLSNGPCGRSMMVMKATCIDIVVRGLSRSDWRPMSATETRSQYGAMGDVIFNGLFGQV